MGIRITATDNVRVTGYYLSEVYTTPPGATIWSTAKPTTFGILSACGSHSVRAWAKDAAGNISKPVKAKIFFDPAPPNLSVLSPPSGQTLNALTRIGGIVGETLPSSGIATGEYAILRRADCSWWNPDTETLVKGKCGTEHWIPFPLPLSAKAWGASTGRLDDAGKYNLSVRIIDRAGNIGLNRSRTFIIN